MRPAKHFAVHILASRRNGTLYAGMTNTLAQCIWQHRANAFKGFAATYEVTRLVWYESHETAIIWERQIKT